MENAQQQVNQEDNPNQNPSVINPISNQRGNFLLIVGVVVLVLVIGAGAYYLGVNKDSSSTNIKNQQIQVSPTTQSSPTGLPTGFTDETANWKTYTNKKYGIEFEYPKELYIWSDHYNNPNNENSLSLNQDDCENIQAAYCGVRNSLAFYVESAENLTLEEWIKVNLFKKSNITSNPSGDGFVDGGEYCYSRTKQEKLTIANLEAFAYSFSWDQLGDIGKCWLNKSYNENYPDIIKEIYFSKNGWIYIFEPRYTKGSDLEKTFTQIISTFKFTQ